MPNVPRSFACFAALAALAGCGADTQLAEPDGTQGVSSVDSVGAIDPGTADLAVRRSPGQPGTPSFSAVAQTSVKVTWSAAARAATYQVQRAPDSAGSPGTFTTIASSVTGTSRTDTALSPATTYWYRVRGKNYVGAGSYSAAASVTTSPTTSGGGGAPSAPTISSLTASPASISSGGSTTLSWTTSGATSLSIDQGVGAVTGTSATVSPASTTTYTLSATNASGSTSASATVTVSVGSGGGGGGVVTASAFYVAHGGNDGRAKSQAASIDTPWATLAHALAQLAPGDTLYIRGGQGPDTNTACTGEGAQGGACWMETASNGYGTSSPMYWVGNSLPAGTAGKPITIACYPGETCIIEPASGNRVVQMSAGDGADNRQCSYLTFDRLVFDARNQSGAVDGFRADPPHGDSDDPTTMCSYVTIKNSTIRHAGHVGGMHFAGYRWTVQNNHITENGRLGVENCSGGECNDEVHGIYLIGGAYNVFDSNLIDHNVQGVQIYNDMAPSSSGHNTWTNNEIAHNGYNPWNHLTRSGDLGDWGCYSGVCAYDTFSGNRIHDNSRWGVNLGPFGSGCSAIRGLVLQNNHLWNNGVQTNQGCGPSIDLESPPGSGSASCGGNLGTQP